jgi:hypothetical protein
MQLTGVAGAALGAAGCAALTLILRTQQLQLLTNQPATSLTQHRLHYTALVHSIVKLSYAARVIVTVLTACLSTILCCVLLSSRLHDMGVLPTKKSLVQTEQLATAAFCRRRLAVVMVRLKMAETVREAATFIEQGHVRVGPNTVTDPAFHVSRTLEDFVTWVDTSKIKRKVLKYNDALDDYLLLNS